MLNLYRNTSDFKSFTATLKSHEIGLVPTMGNLHLGHLSLIKESLSKNPVTIVTIFVNPKQFGKDEDLNSYPRSLDQDLALIQSLSREFTGKKVAVFAPLDANEIYPQDFSTSIEVEGPLSEILCAKSRPRHFKGVTTVVFRLFQLSKAGHAYFGQKDFQQYKIIEKMCTDLDLSIKLNMMPIVRTGSGLALSSRNQYLTQPQKELSLRLKAIISTIEDLILNDQTTTAVDLCLKLEQNEFEYLQIRNSIDLKEITNQTRYFIILGALEIGNTRLIDNQLVDLNAR